MTTGKDRTPRARREVWIHLDQFNKPDGRTWAIQSRQRDGRHVYATARHVILTAPVVTRDWGVSRRQPRAVLVAREV